MFSILFGYDGQVADLEPVVRGEILQGVLVILGDLIRGKPRRHDRQVCREATVFVGKVRMKAREKGNKGNLQARVATLRDIGMLSFPPSSCFLFFSFFPFSLPVCFFLSFLLR